MHLYIESIKFFDISKEDKDRVLKYLQRIGYKISKSKEDVYYIKATEKIIESYNKVESLLSKSIFIIVYTSLSLELPLKFDFLCTKHVGGLLS